MRLKSLSVEQYRNYNAVELAFEPNEPIMTIVGPNAQGKTNILEAIYLLALTKSFRTNKQQDMIMWEKDYCRVKGVLEMDRKDAAQPDAAPETLELELFFGRPPQPLKALKINGVRTSAVKFIGNCQIVFFHPEDLNMLYLGPNLRRRYLDILNIQVNPAYYRALRSYRRVLKQRNALLRNIKEGIARPDDLDIWDEQLAEHGSIIIEERAKTIDFLNENIREMYRRIAGTESAGSNESQGEDCDATVQYAASTREFAQKLREQRHIDIEARITTCGPHRDDMQLLLRDRPLETHASRGEYRTMLLSLKLLELTFYEQKTGQKPILLLDDVFSELDEHRQKSLLQSIEGCQTIITATHLEPGILPDHQSKSDQSSTSLGEKNRKHQVLKPSLQLIAHSLS